MEAPHRKSGGNGLKPVYFTTAVLPLQGQAGGFSGWHAHPAPVFVTVVQGTIVWYDGSNPLCTGNTYSAGQSFVEGAYVPHNVWSADGAQFIAVVIKPAGFPGPAFRLDRPKPNNCNF